eukprot:CAMPEP_0176378716 /NCGR_PEP_ID=MMETSP0126-20121128/29822_1 /TAXON_ID=141414 ORGANISM="Strombidinopsis acuminatum, Strain SPMC142" /NCGR_SAMPLE_ID=MMETSP0126 /ASSEMBLY_ACC=CAM_ASM_000229 /LENGTH=75 /DNA_ID=CAMNT_0017741143 /DNA_START=409 /DNA_END=636 /DNA_ORIENTATION=+
MEKFLEFLSGDNYLKETEVREDDMKAFLGAKLGLLSNPTNFFSSYYTQQLEKQIYDKSKAFFKSIKLNYWPDAIK